MRKPEVKTTVRGPGPVATPEPAPAAPQLVTVCSPDGKPFWERHPDHPKGEAWVAGDGGRASPPVRVALTDAVKRALREGRLERVEASGGDTQVA